MLILRKFKENTHDSLRWTETKLLVSGIELKIHEGFLESTRNDNTLYLLIIIYEKRLQI